MTLPGRPSSESPEQPSLDAPEADAYEEALSSADLRAAALQGLRWAVVARPLVEFVLFVTLVVLARLIQPAEFGRYAVALVFGELMLIPGQAVGIALVQRSKVGPEYFQTGLALALLIGLGVVAITLVTATLIIVPIYGEHTAYLVRLTAIGCIVNSVNVIPSAVLQRRLAFRRLNVVQVATTIATAVASIGLALALRNATALVVGGLIGMVAGTALLWRWAPPPLPRLHRGPSRDLRSYGTPAGIAAVSWVGFRNCDYAIVAARLGAFQAGLYFRAYTLGVEYQKKVSQLMYSVGFPLLARTRDMTDQLELRKRMVRLLTLVLFPALVLLAIEARVLITRLFGPQWAAAVVPTQILAIGGAATLVIDAIGPALQAAGRARAIMGYGWGHFVTYGTAVLIVAPLGIVAVAIAAAIVHSLFVLVAYILLLQPNRDPPLRQLSGACKQLADDIVPATVCCAALACVAVPVSLGMSAVGVSALLSLPVVTLAGIAAYLAALKLLYPASFGSLHTLARELLPRRPRGIFKRTVRVAQVGPTT